MIGEQPSRQYTVFVDECGRVLKIVASRTRWVEVTPRGIRVSRRRRSLWFIELPGPVRNLVRNNPGIALVLAHILLSEKRRFRFEIFAYSVALALYEKATGIPTRVPPRFREIVDRYASGLMLRPVAPCGGD